MPPGCGLCLEAAAPVYAKIDRDATRMSDDTPSVIQLSHVISQAAAPSRARRANQSKPVQPFREKFSSCGVGQIRATSSPRPFPARGAYRDRHERGRGCGGRGSVGARVVRRAVFRERATARRTNGAIRVRQNRVVPTPVAGAKLPVVISIRPDSISHQAGSDGGKTNSSPGRARYKP
jgi:hypothetical protein